jgi:hypothetical protein
MFGKCRKSPTGVHQETHHSFWHGEKGTPDRVKTLVFYCYWCGEITKGTKPRWWHPKMRKRL